MDGGIVIQAAGASIQIAGDVLANSTERLVVVSGSDDAVIRAIFHISDVMLQVRSTEGKTPWYIATLCDVIIAHLLPLVKCAPLILRQSSLCCAVFTYEAYYQIVIQQPSRPRYSRLLCVTSSTRLQVNYTHVV